MADERLPWFPCEPSKLLGALGAMKPYVGYTYWIVCLRCYEVGSACPDNLDALARRTGYSKRVVSDALDVLFKSGKLIRNAAGIDNPYAAKVISGMRLRREGHVAAGREGANRRWEKGKKNQSRGDSQPIQSPMAKNAYLDLEEESLFPNGNSAPNGTPAKPIDVRTDLFRRGLAVLIRISGRTENGCRTLIGKWLKNANDDAIKVLRAVEDAERERPANPVSWIERVIGYREKTTSGRGGNAWAQVRREVRESKQGDEDEQELSNPDRGGALSAAGRRGGY